MSDDCYDGAPPDGMVAEANEASDLRAENARLRDALRRCSRSIRESPVTADLIIPQIVRQALGDDL